MIIGIGCDLAEVSRIKRALGMKGFAARVFTQREQDYCQARGAQAYASFAARFAAKEAFVKAVGTGLRGGRGRSLSDLLSQFDAHGAGECFLSDGDDGR